MKTKTIVVNLIPIDPEKLEIIKVPGTNETFKFNLLLDAVPDSVWKDFFNMNYGKTDTVRARAAILSPNLYFEFIIII